MTEIFIILLVSIAIFIALFLFFRALFLWYWRVNDILNNQCLIIEGQNDTIHRLERIIELLEGKIAEKEDQQKEQE